MKMAKRKILTFTVLLAAGAMLAIAADQTFSDNPQDNDNATTTWRRISVDVHNLFIRAADTDRSGTITLGGTPQQAMAANSTRSHLFFQNISDTAMYIRWTGTAAASSGSVLIPANGGSYENPSHFCPTGALSVFCATTGKSFTATEN